MPKTNDDEVISQDTQTPQNQNIDDLTLSSYIQAINDCPQRFDKEQMAKDIAGDISNLTQEQMKAKYPFLNLQ